MIRTVRQTIKRARRRYHAASLTDRPALECPSSVIGFFTADEMLLLAKTNTWPLPRSVIRFIRTTPAVRQAQAKRRRRHWLADLFTACSGRTLLLKRLLWGVLRSRGSGREVAE